jgi:prepilin-type N-terminal cleavage/methylation domain-containing protein
MKSFSCHSEFNRPAARRDSASRAFVLTELLVVLAVLSVLAAIAVPIILSSRAKSRFALCKSNLQQVNRAVLQYANEHSGFLPEMTQNRPPGGWWWYKEEVKTYVGLTGPSSANDKVFACPDDRGYGETAKNTPFWKTAKFNFTSYVLNSVNLPGMPHIAGRQVASIVSPEKTLLVMEWTAHAPLSWHRSKTGRKNTPFYNDAESMVGFVDGHIGFVPIYYDGYSAAFTRDPIPGYAYKYSGD